VGDVKISNVHLHNIAAPQDRSLSINHVYFGEFVSSDCPAQGVIRAPPFPRGDKGLQETVSPRPAG
jgi:hypothetical protein